jgi:hypothetical protein
MKEVAKTLPIKRTESISDELKQMFKITAGSPRPERLEL